MPEWPVDLRGITESVVTTQREDGAWNIAALGLQATQTDAEGESGASEDVTARTWGETRTRGGFRRDGRGYVQFTSDPVVLVEAALGDRVAQEPVLSSADAWAEVAVTRVDTGTEGGTSWTDWALEPTETEVERQVVPTVNRGFGAVVEAAVATSRLDVEAYDSDRLRERLDYFQSVARRCGGSREREAIDRLEELHDDG